MKWREVSSVKCRVHKSCINSGKNERISQDGLESLKIL